MGVIDVDTQNNQTFETRYQKNNMIIAIVKLIRMRLFVSDEAGNGDRFQLAEQTGCLVRLG